MPEANVKNAEPQPKNQEPLIEGRDYYREGPYLVFTEAYHLRRGSCCGSGCRHCPWRNDRGPGPARQDSNLG